MSEKSYLTNAESLKSYTDLNYLDLDEHETLWKKIIDTHSFNQAVKKKKKKYTDTIRQIKC